MRRHTKECKNLYKCGVNQNNVQRFGGDGEERCISTVRGELLNVFVDRSKKVNMYVLPGTSWETKEKFLKAAFPADHFRNMVPERVKRVEHNKKRVLLALLYEL